MPHALSLPSSRFARPARRVLIGATLLHLALLAAFVWSLMSAAASLAAAPACTGDDLWARMQADDPAGAAAIEAEARTVPNGESRLWQVSRPGQPASFLLGTMHSADPRVATLPPAVAAALASADRLLVENADAFDPARMNEALARLAPLILAERPLDSVIAADLQAPARTALEARGVSWELARRLRPWFLAATLALPLCESAAKAAGVPMLDARLAAEAKAAGKPVVSLETIEEQLAAVAGLPETYHKAGLEELLRQGARADDAIETLRRLYLADRIDLMQPLIRALTPEASAADGSDAFQREVIAVRNHRMVERAAPAFESGPVLMAVGALHLPGEEGVVALLRQRGFTVAAVPIGS